MKERKIISKRAKALVVSFVILAMIVLPAGTINISAAEVEFNYAKALQYSQYFYDANMCGTGVEENGQYNWRSDCHIYDAELPIDSVNTNMSDSFISTNMSILDPDGDGKVDVSGGFHDAGDHVKFGMPEAYSGSTLGWGYYEFREQYGATGQDEHAETILRYFNDYFMRCTFRDESGNVVAFCYQVGDGDIDHAYWNAPEVDEMFRRGWFATEELPSTDCVAAAAASLVANYMNFKDTDPEYAEKSLDYAKALFEFAEKNDKEVNDDGPKGYYSSSKWEDDYCWAAAWLYLATQDDHYLDEIFKYYDYYAPSCWTHCWNDVWVGTACILGQIDDLYDKDSEQFENRYREAANKSPYEPIDFWGEVAKLVDNWMTGKVGEITPGGYAFLNQWGSARYNTATQFAALVYDKHHGDTPSKYSEWARTQMEYLMGDNPLNRCYIVGYSDNSAKFPHHRAASGLSKCEDLDPHKYVLYGALVGGPGADDQHQDTTADWIYNEVTIDYNAAFVGACAGLYRFFGDSSMQVTPDFPPVVEVEDPDNGGNSYWVEAFGVDIAQADGPKVTEVTLYVCSDVRKTSKNISIRYYFDATGMTSLEPNSIEMRQLYDQVATETDYAAQLTGPHHYKDNIYYIEVAWDGFVIANSNKKYQFALGTYAWGNCWNPLDDWSYQELSIEESNYTGTPVKNGNICVYDAGVLVGGIEPDGTTPQISPPPQPTPSEEPEIMYGDLNGDSKINSTDLTVMKRYLLKIIQEFNVPEEAADLNGDGKVNSTDLTIIKRYLLRIITVFPVDAK